MSRTVLHVLPNPDKTEQEKWIVKLENSVEVLEKDKTQKGAITKAQKIIAAQIKVHGKNNEFLREYTYGLDPDSSEG